MDLHHFRFYYLVHIIIYYYPPSIVAIATNYRPPELHLQHKIYHTLKKKIFPEILERKRKKLSNKPGYRFFSFVFYFAFRFRFFLFRKIVIKLDFIWIHLISFEYYARTHTNQIQKSKTLTHWMNICECHMNEFLGRSQQQFYQPKTKENLSTTIVSSIPEI